MNMQYAYSLPNLTKISHYGFATLYQNNIPGKNLYMQLLPHNKGDVFSTFEAAETLTAPNKYTVQVNDDVHIILSPEFLQYINHSCDPNIFFDTSKMELSCLKNIAAR